MIKELFYWKDLPSLLRECKVSEEDTDFIKSQFFRGLLSTFALCDGVFTLRSTLHGNKGKKDGDTFLNLKHSVSYLFTFNVHGLWYEQKQAQKYTVKYKKGRTGYTTIIQTNEYRFYLHHKELPSVSTENLNKITLVTEDAIEVFSGTENAFVVDKANFPRLYRMVLTSKANLENQLLGLAKAQNSSPSTVAVFLEMDLSQS